MKPVRRDELLDFATFTDRRDELMPAVLRAKAARRIHVGSYLTFLFENALTIRWQVQEMLRVERIVREADIAHELATYNALLGKDGELGCTLLVEIEDERDRAALLRRWVALPEHLYALTPDGRRVRPVFDERQRREDKLSSVQYLTFAVGRDAPLALGCDLDELRTETKLSGEQRAALTEDLRS